MGDKKEVNGNYFGKNEINLTIPLERLVDRKKAIKKAVERVRGQPVFNSEMESHAASNASGWATRKNIGTYFTFLGKALLGGKMFEDYDAEGAVVKDLRREEYLKQFKPDIIDRSSRTNKRALREFKSFSRNYGGSIICLVAQADNYLYDYQRVLQEADEGERELDVQEAGFEYGFFRYKDPLKPLPDKKKSRKKKAYSKKDRRLKLSSLSKDVFLEKLSKGVGDLILLPPNLASTLFAVSPIEVRDQTSSESSLNFQKYRKVQSGWLSALHEGNGGLDEMVAGLNQDIAHGQVQGFEEGFSKEDLYLDRLKFERADSPRILINGKYRVESFPVSIYDFKSKGAKSEWSDFYREGGDMFNRLMGAGGEEDVVFRGKV